MQKHLLAHIAALILLTSIILSSCGSKEVAPVAEADGVTAFVQENVTPPVKENTTAPVKENVAVLAEEHITPLRDNIEMIADSVKVDSVLSLIPEDAIGLVYLSNLLGLNDEINSLLAEMVPEDPPQELLAKILADTFGAGFESLEELEELGFDFNKDFAIFLASMNPPIPSAAVHVKDRDKVVQLVESEAEGSISATHNGVTYYMTGEEGAFVILGDVMVYSASTEVCKKAIDTHQKTRRPISKNIDYASLKLDVTSGINDIVTYFAMEKIIEAIRPMLVEGVEEMKSGMEKQVEANPQLASGLQMSHKMIDIGLSFLDQTKSLGMTLQLNGSDLKLSPLLTFKSGSEIQEKIRTTPRELADIKYLPQSAFVNMGLQMKAEDWLKLITSTALFSPQGPNADAEQVEKALAEYTMLSKAFYESVSDEIAVSVNFGESIIPEWLGIMSLIDEQKMKGFMGDYLAFLKSADRLYQAMDSSAKEIFIDAAVGPSEMYNDVEIKSYTLPNYGKLFSELPSEIGALAPKQGNIFYAIKSGKLFLSMSANANQVKKSLDRLGGTGPGFDEGAGYDKLTGTLPQKNNMFAGISPLTAVNSLVRIFAQMDPNVGMMQMFLANIPQTYSIGVASQNRDGGVEAQLLIALGDFKELIMMAASMQQMQ